MELVALDDLRNRGSRVEPGIEALLADPQEREVFLIDSGRAQVLNSLRLAGLVTTKQQAAHIAVHVWPAKSAE